MKYLVSLITLFASLFATAQQRTSADSMEEVYVEYMRGEFRKIDSLSIPYAAKNELQFEKIRSFIKSNPKENMSAHFIEWGKYFNTEEIDSLYNLLDTSLQKIVGLKSVLIHQKMRSLIIPAKPFPALTLTDTLNRKLSIADLKGKIVLINIWSSDCRPCREEMPQLISLYEKYKDKGLVIIGISTDENKENWVKAIVKDQQSWQQFCELKPWLASTIFLKWGISFIPYNFLIDQEGKLIDKEMGITTLENLVSQQFR